MPRANRIPIGPFWIISRRHSRPYAHRSYDFFEILGVMKKYFYMKFTEIGEEVAICRYLSKNLQKSTRKRRVVFHHPNGSDYRH